MDDVIAKLRDDSFRFLTEPIFPFGRHMVPVIARGGRFGNTIRYYRTQLQLSLQKSGSNLSEALHIALQALDEAINDSSIHYRFRLQPRDLLIVNNKKTLHGRTGFGDESRRLLLRGRVYCRELA